MRRDDRHHILSLTGPPHTRGASTSPFSMSPHRGAWIMSFREDSTTSARWTTTTSAPNNPSISSITEIARCIILTSSKPSELTACTSPNAGHTYSFSGVMGTRRPVVVERCGGYGVLNNEARVTKITRPRTLEAGGLDLVCWPPGSLRGVLREDTALFLIRRYTGMRSESGGSASRSTVGPAGGSGGQRWHAPGTSPSRQPWPDTLQSTVDQVLGHGLDPVMPETPLFRSTWGRRSGRR